MDLILCLIVIKNLGSNIIEKQPPMEQTEI